MTDEVLHTQLRRHVQRAVARAVVDHQVLDRLDPRDVSRHLLEDQGEGLLLVEARDLHN